MLTWTLFQILLLHPVGMYCYLSDVFVLFEGFSLQTFEKFKYISMAQIYSFLGLYVHGLFMLRAALSANNSDVCLWFRDEWFFYAQS